MREGSLEAPTRHPIDWKSEDYYDQSKLVDEMERVFDVCHTCRRCVSLCNSFPTLFDLIDEATSGELDTVEKKQFGKVVDQCYLCDMCFLSKCPYVPPHDWNIDFPHLMLRAKAVKFRDHGAKFRDKLLSSTDAIGKLASIPVVSRSVNAANKNGVVRTVMEKTLGIHRERVLPPYASKGVDAKLNRAPSEGHRGAAGSQSLGKVVIFSTCYYKYNEPSIGEDLVAVLEHNKIEVKQLRSEVCCGMPKLELGDLENVEKLKESNIAELSKLAREGWSITTGVPSCTLMFKQELPLMFPDDEDVLAVQDAMCDPFEFLSLQNKSGLLNRDFEHSLGTIAYHIPCHLRVQNIGQKTREILELIPDTKVGVVERCSGHDGTWGVKKEYYPQSMKIGRPVFRKMAEQNPQYISSDCAIASLHIQQGIEKQTGEVKDKAHPISLLRKAYGI